MRCRWKASVRTSRTSPCYRLLAWFPVAYRDSSITRPSVLSLGMKPTDNVTHSSSITRGLLFGALGVLAFSFTFPATRAAVAELDATFVGLGRALVAAMLAAALLVFLGERAPERRHLGRIALVAVGVVVGFPLFSALALKDLPSAHGAVIVGLLPAATAVMAVLRAGERPSRGFWFACAFGLVAVLVFAVIEGAGRPQAADALVLLAVLLGAVGYAEGGVLAREIGGWRVICWALLFSAPLVLPAVALELLWVGPSAALSGGFGAWLGFAYVSTVSMFLGFFAWYRGLAEGGVARVGQLQLAQPLLTFLWSALLLGEEVGPLTVLAGALVLLSVGLGQRTRVRRVALPGHAFGVSGTGRQEEWDGD